MAETMTRSALLSELRQARELFRLKIDAVRPDAEASARPGAAEYLAGLEGMAANIDQARGLLAAAPEDGRADAIAARFLDRLHEFVRREDDAAMGRLVRQAWRRMQGRKGEGGA